MAATLAAPKFRSAPLRILPGCSVLTGSDSTLLERKKLFTQFGSRENFIEAHKEFKEYLGEEFYLE